MTAVNLKGAVLALAKACPAFTATAAAAQLAAPRVNVVRAIRKLRIEGRVVAGADGAYSYIPGSVSPPCSIHDPMKAERARRFVEARRQLLNQPTLPIVQWALINSPTSVWAYAARSAS